METVRTVLVVDDSTLTAKQLTRLLDGSGRYRVVGHAASGVEAVKLFKEQKPQLVCLDMIMPELDGISALRILRALDPTVPVVMVSSVGGVADKVEECLKAGARNVIGKPFEPAQVLKVLDAV